MKVWYLYRLHALEKLKFHKREHGCPYGLDKEYCNFCIEKSINFF